MSVKVTKKYLRFGKDIGFLKSTAEDRARFDEIKIELWRNQDGIDGCR